MGSRVKAVLALLVVLAGAALVATWLADQRAKRAEQQLGLDAARVLSVSFAKANALKVLDLDGEVLAQSEASILWGAGRATQRTRAPFSVNYFVDLSKVTPASMRWDAGTRTMLVEVPDITTERPSIDLSRAQVSQDGLYISRRAGQALQQQSYARLVAKAQEESAKPANVLRARAAAREAIASNVAAPLAAAGLGDVTVQVRLAGDPLPGDRIQQQWDMSRSIPEVYRDFKN